MTNNASWNGTSMDDYDRGFGATNSVFWLGNYFNTLLTSFSAIVLRVDMWDAVGVHYHTEFKGFKIGNLLTGFELTYEKIIAGNAGDGGIANHGFNFTIGQNCPSSVGWWHAPWCNASVLTGTDKRWIMPEGQVLEVDKVLMRIRPQNITTSELFAFLLNCWVFKI